MMVFSVCMNVCILIYTSACGEATCDERWLSFTSCIIIIIIMVVVSVLKVVVCVFEFGGLHSKVLVCKLQFYTVCLQFFCIFFVFFW